MKRTQRNPDKFPRPVQYFSDAYLQHCREMSPSHIAEFLENFRMLQGNAQSEGKQKMISIRIPESLLMAFRTKCEAEGKKYQSHIKDLMQQWLLKGSPVE
jgi:predicted DNA binding CopG/RHH family protein